jgi:hypothetical protein
MVGMGVGSTGAGTGSDCASRNISMAASCAALRFVCFVDLRMRRPFTRKSAIQYLERPCL